jgi:hypothetical protein
MRLENCRAVVTALAVVFACVIALHAQNPAITKAWQLTASNTIARLLDIGVSGQSLTTTLPPQSITLFVLGGTGTPPRAPTGLTVAGER